VRRFVRASLKSWKYAIEHQDEAIAAFGRVTDRPKASIAQQQLKTTLSLLTTPRTKGKPLGWMSTDDWRETIGFLEEYGGLPKGITPERVFTNAFVEGK
jgi:NitT/TauT family transport system substrate-binding protein